MFDKDHRFCVCRFPGFCAFQLGGKPCYDPKDQRLIDEFCERFHLSYREVIEFIFRSGEENVK